MLNLALPSYVQAFGGFGIIAFFTEGYRQRVQSPA
jgi:hypothetical protein